MMGHFNFLFSYTRIHVVLVYHWVPTLAVMVAVTSIVGL